MLPVVIPVSAETIEEIKAFLRAEGKEEPAEVLPRTVYWEVDPVRDEGANARQEAKLRELEGWRRDQRAEDRGL